MLKSIDGPTEAADISDGEFKNSLAVKYILFAAFRLSLGEAWLQTDCGGRVTAVLLNKNDGTIICPSGSADLRELSEFTSFFGGNIYFCSGNDCADAKAVLMELSELPQKETRTSQNNTQFITLTDLNNLDLLYTALNAKHITK